MKNLLEGEKLLSKEEMKSIGGGSGEFCNFREDYICPSGCNVLWACYVDYWHNCTDNIAYVWSGETNPAQNGTYSNHYVYGCTYAY
jgi:hypothetical protein